MLQETRDMISPFVLSIMTCELTPVLLAALGPNFHTSPLTDIVRLCAAD